MSNEEKILKALEALQQGQEQLTQDVTAIKTMQQEQGNMLQEQGKKIDMLLDAANRTQTAIETLDEKIDATKTEVDEIKRHQRPQKAD